MANISTKLKKRLQHHKIPYAANDCISDYLEEGELQLLQLELEEKVQSLLSTLVIDTESDHNTKDTAKRVAKMMLHETFKGRYYPKPNITEFPNAKQLDELYAVGPIQVNSTCSHHLVPIIGKLWVGVHPGERVIGLSKFHRLADWVFSRPQIQEEMTVQFAHEIFTLINPLGLAVVFKATHFCTSCRGVKDPDTVMTTSVVLGSIREQPHLKSEFFQLIR